jgi:hypothetical protein
MIHFTKGMVFWECCDTVATETYPEGFPDWEFKAELVGVPYALKRAVQLWRRDSQIPAMPNSRHQHLPPSPTLHYHYLRIRELWLRLLQDYTALGMTEERDRLKALQGILDDIAEVFNECHAFGRFPQRLLDELLWQTSGFSQSSNLSRSVRQSQWRAPSWSWASLNTGISYPYPPDIQGDLRPLACANLEASRTGYQAEAVCPGCLSISCRLIKTRLQHWDDMGAGLCRCSISKSIVDITLRMDYPSSERYSGQEDDTFLIPIYEMRQADTSTGLQGLAVSCLDSEKNVYERIGAIYKVTSDDTPSALEQLLFLCSSLPNMQIALR